MLFLGFSAGVPILLIFSSLSLWLGEAGVQKSAVTFFSWAALGYSFKFVWAPLVDKMPLPLLTKWLGRRRSWMLLSQFMVIGAILWMAFTDPASSPGSLTIMALAAVLLGFSSATQDVVIDAYRIESAQNELQALMSSTYIAGYRIGMIAAGAGALYLAHYFGSEKDAYNYTAWMNTYTVMAGVMLIGVLTTLIIPEPAEYQASGLTYNTSDYARFFLLFVLAVASFIAIFFLSSKAGYKIGYGPFYEMVQAAKEHLTAIFSNKKLASLLVETGRLSAAILTAWLIAKVMMGAKIVNGTMVKESYVDPIRDFFTRYGMGLAILLLCLVGFYRISDIVLGAIANVFYQDLGYTKLDIANASKVFGLVATIIGGFLGGLLAVRYGVMKILFLGAVLSALTNLLFIWLSQTDAFTTNAFLWMSQSGVSFFTWISSLGFDSLSGFSSAGANFFNGLAVSGAGVFKLFIVIGADNLSAGLASAAFIAFLSSLTNISFTAVQYAIFSSLMTLFPKVLGGYSGTFVQSMGYTNFFIMTTLLTIPVAILILVTSKYFKGEVKMAT
ncbi:MFS transporter [Leucothrix arctica]|uniref:MFS transporter n=2 Tax=Leucothrix arctica TaxID=1481894 RepID=A0A317C6H1_9GAMM|nr:MFS transporter [Leucothrix arctica]